MATPLRGNRIVPFNKGALQDAILGGIEERPEGVPFDFFYGGKKHTWTRYRSDGRMRLIGFYAPAQLVGHYARALLGDPLGQPLAEALAQRRMHETEADRAERLARVKRREAFATADHEARAQPARHHDW
jgi:hypothetical protein